MSKKLYWLLALILVLAGVLAGCQQATQPVATEPAGAQPEATEAEATEPPATGEPAQAGEVIIGTTDQLDSLDPADAYAVHDWELLREVNPTLMGFTPGTAEVVPQLAEAAPEVSEDGLTYTFKIATGWKFPDGTEMVAADIARTINRTLTLEGDVSGLVTTYVDSVETPDDRTLVVHLKSPRGDFVQMTTGTPYSPSKEGTYPEDALEKFPPTLEGVGPWKLVSYNVEEQAVFERNPNYKPGFGEKAPVRVIVRYFSDPTQMALAVEKGDIDIAWRILGPIESGRLSTVEGLTAYNTGGGGIRFLSITHTQEPFGDKNVRQALAYLVDRDEIIDRVYQGTVTPLYSIVPPGFVGANDAFLDRYGNAPDVAKAEELLTASGYSADSPLAFDLWYPPEHYGSQAAQIFELLKAQFEVTPMIKVTLQTQEWGTYIKAILGGEYPIGYLGWFFDWPDTSNYLEPFAQSNYDQSQGVFYASEEMDKFLADAGASTDQDERASLYVEAQNLYAEDAVGIPLLLEAEYAVFRNDTIKSIIIGPAIVFQYELIEMQ